MAIGIVCTVVIGLVALYQTLVSRILFRKCVARDRVIETQRMAIAAAAEMAKAIADILPIHYAAAERGDARQCNAILGAAVAAANAARERCAAAMRRSTSTTSE